MPAPTKYRAAIRIAGFILLAVLALLAVSLKAADKAAAQSTTDGQLAEGARLFAQNCAVCHGADGQGRVGATLAKNWPSIRPDLTVKTIITNGVPGSKMPAWGESKGGLLTAAEIDALTAYILSWQTGGSADIIILPTPTPLPPVTPVPEITGDTVHGAELFQQNCIMCHGESGQGKIGRTLAKNWSGVRPDLLIRNTIINGIPNTKMPSWGQANGGPLSEKDVDDLTAYILALPKTTEIQTSTEPPAPVQLSWLSGWGGVVVFVVLLALVFVFAFWIQRRKS